MTEKIRKEKIDELKHRVNQDSPIGSIDNICQVERLCDELDISFDEAYTLYEGESSTWTNIVRRNYKTPLPDSFGKRK